MTITPEKVRALLEAATPGPWAERMGDIVQLTDAGKGYPLDQYPDSTDVVLNCDGFGMQYAADARLIAACPDIARAYLEAVEGLRKYGRHAITCEHRRAGHKPSTPCTCGLDALLAGSKP